MYNFIIKILTNSWWNFRWNFKFYNTCMSMVCGDSWN